MVPNLYEADLHVGRQKALAHAAADAYDHTPRAPRRGLRTVYRSALITAGGALIRLGRRLQGEIDELAVPDLGDQLTRQPG